MSIGDRVKMGVAEHNAGNIPVYKLKLDNTGNLLQMRDGVAVPYVVGGIKPGSFGQIINHPVYVERMMLVGVKENMVAALGADLVPLFPIYVEEYKQEVYIPGDFFKIVSGPA